MYNSVHNFNKYSELSLNGISSICSKFDTLNKFYEDFKRLEYSKSKTKETKQKKITVLKMHQCLLMS